MPWIPSRKSFRGSRMQTCGHWRVLWQWRSLAVRPSTSSGHPPCRLEELDFVEGSVCGGTFFGLHKGSIVCS